MAGRLFHGFSPAFRDFFYGSRRMKKQLWTLNHKNRQKTTGPQYVSYYVIA